MAETFEKSPQGKIDAKTGLTNGGIYVEDWKVSAQNNTFVQRGSFTLAASKKFITFPRAYLSSQSTQNLTFIVTSQTANHVYVESVAKNSAFGVNVISTVCGFTISTTGSSTGTDNGFWLTLGYR